MKMQPPLVSLINAVVHLKRAEAKSCSQVAAIRSALEELMLAYCAMQKPWDVDFEEAVATAMLEISEAAVTP
jgi:hypothetical protein